VRKTNLDIAINYANSVVNNVVPACLYVKQACTRFLDDISDSNDLYYYSDRDVNMVVKFINNLNLTEQSKPKKFILEDWQTFIICNIYGIKRKDNNKRKYRNGYIELARKNGKSQLVTALSMYHLLIDNDAQVIVSANSKEQAKNVDFKKLKQFALQLDPKQRELIHYYNSLKFGTNELIVTASDSKKLDGLNPSFCLIDELHEAPDNSMYNVFKSGMGSRPEPLLVTITTAGFDTESFCYELRTYCTDILSGVKKDDTQFCIIYTLDEGDDFSNPDVWVKANPNLNISVQSDFLGSEVLKANNNVSEKSGVLVKNFNKWLKANTIEEWLDEDTISYSLQDIDFSDEKFKDAECIVGVDLASVSDITAVSYLFSVDGYKYFINKYYIPEDSINSKKSIMAYKEAAQSGYINITPGNVTDYDYILSDIIKVNEHNPVKSIYYDKYNSTQFIIDATEAGLKCVPFSQMPGSLNKPLKEFERQIKSKNNY